MDISEFIVEEKRLIDSGTVGWKGTGTGESWYLYGLIRALRPNCVVEVGVCDGGTSVWIAKALQDNNAGQLFCVDLQQMDLARNRAKLLQVDDRINFLVGDSRETANKWPHGKCIEVLFIDGNHTCLGASEDFNSWTRYAKQHAYVVAHDAFGSHPLYQVNEFFQTVARLLPTQWLYTGEWGLAVTQLDRPAPTS